MSGDRKLIENSGREAVKRSRPEVQSSPPGGLLAILILGNLRAIRGESQSRHRSDNLGNRVSVDILRLNDGFDG